MQALGLDETHHLGERAKLGRRGFATVDGDEVGTVGHGEPSRIILALSRNLSGKSG